MSKTTRCPKCSSELPAKGRFCLECGLDLYEEGLRRPPFPWPVVGILVVVLGGVALYMATQSRVRKPPPENDQVREATLDLLRLAGEKQYATIVDRYYTPDAKAFEAVHNQLADIVRGDIGRAGLNVFRAKCMNNLEEANKFVKDYGAAHPVYVVAVLAALTFQDGALRSDFGGTLAGTERTDAFLAWNLGVIFRGVDAAQGEIKDVRWGEDPGGELLMVATVTYPEPVGPLPGVDNPTIIRWRRLGPGSWGLTLGARPRLDEVLVVLSRAKF